jgi:Ca2+-binding EF-hand superfamily protein
MKEGNMGRTFYVIVDGDVEICQRTSFEDPLTTPPSYLGTVINRFEQGEFFGERALITGEARAASIRAGMQTKCLAFDKDGFPPSCVLSGVRPTEKLALKKTEDLMDNIKEKYGVDLGDLQNTMNERQYMDNLRATQVRGSPNHPEPINSVDNDKEYVSPEEEMEKLLAPTMMGKVISSGGLQASTEVIIPLLQHFKLIRLVTRCFEYILGNRLRFGVDSARRRRSMLVNLLSQSQQVEFTDAYNLIDSDADGEITLMELRRLMDSIGGAKSDKKLVFLIETSNQEMDGRQVITYPDFMGLMAEAEFYHLFLDTFRALDTRDLGYVRAKDLDRVLCGVRDLITDDRRSIIDVEDTEMMVDYEQLFSKMLLGTALK